jgi:uncharacterized protein (TIGR02246 family)
MGFATNLRLAHWYVLFAYDKEMIMASTDPRQNDEQAIRQLVNDWLEASKRNDLDALLSLMADDVIFMVPGQEPFGKEAFASRSKQMDQMKLEAKSSILEIKVLGDWAWMRSHLQISVTQPDGEKMEKSGYILTILNKKSDGRWVISRDANLLT